MNEEETTCGKADEHHSGSMRGRGWALVRDGQVLRSGSEPSAEFSPATATNSEEHFRDMADQMGAQLYVGAPATVEAQSQERIFGMTWDELLQRQQRGGTARRIHGRMPVEAVMVYSGCKSAGLSEA
jgi:hypothetical protein